MICIFDLDDTLYDTSDRLDGVTPNFETMKLYRGARSMLQSLRCDLVLVTFGDRRRQERKIDTLGVREYFKEVLICSKTEKKHDLFKNILKKYRIKNPQEVFVIGDRIDSEIRYGKKLGCRTVHFKRGKYSKLLPKDDKEVPDHTIKTFEELGRLLSSYS